MGPKNSVDGRFKEVKVNIGRGAPKNEVSKTAGSGRNGNYKVKTGPKSSNPNNFGLIRENLNLPEPENSTKNQDFGVVCPARQPMSSPL